MMRVNRYVGAIGLVIAGCALAEAPSGPTSESYVEGPRPAPTSPPSRPSVFAEFRAAKDGLGRTDGEPTEVRDIDNDSIELRCPSLSQPCVIINRGPLPINIDGYSLTGPAGSFNPAGWQSIQDAADASVEAVLGTGTNAASFQKIANPSSSVLAEVNVPGYARWEPLDSWSIGFPLAALPGKEVKFRYTTPPSPPNTPGKVWEARLIPPIAELSRGEGTVHSCVRWSDGFVKCWGANSLGGLGLGDTTPRGNTPGSMALLPRVDLGLNGDMRAKALTTTSGHTCALLETSQIKCWGFNTYGQLGVGDTAFRGDNPGEMGDALPAVNLGTGRSAKVVEAASGRVCAILDNDQLKCWGLNDYGQLGLGDTLTRGDAPGELGDALQAVNLGTGRTAKAIAGGAHHQCALLDNNQVKCWGNGAAHGLGDFVTRGDAFGEMGDALLPVDLGTGRTAKAISAGMLHTCVILDNDLVKCWGSNFMGEIGLGDTTWRGNQPGQMGDNLPYVSLGIGRTAKSISAGGYYHSCAVLDNDQVKCWGMNHVGQLGLGDVAFRGDGAAQMGDLLPSPNLGTGRSAKTIAPGYFRTCALLDNGRVKCWGHYNQGGLGLGDNTVIRGDDAGEMGDALPFLDLRY